MSNAKAQHQMVCALVQEYPDLTLELAELSGFDVSEYGQPVAVPASYPMPDGSTIEGDATVQFQGENGKARFFAQVEMQRKYGLGKLATLRAYYGGEVRRSQCGGHMYVLSPQEAETRKFRENDALYREELAYRASYLSGADLAPFAAPDRSLQARALAAAMTDMAREGVPPGARDLLLELHDHGKDLVADLFVKAMMEECADISELEVGMTDAAMDRLLTLPSFRDFVARREAETAAKTEAQTEVKTEIRVLKNSLKTYFAAKDDILSASALAVLRQCSDPDTLENWLERAYRGETSDQILGNGSAS